MATYLRTLKSLADSLAAINSPVSHKDLVIYALTSLPLEYEYFLLLVSLRNQASLSRTTLTKPPWCLTAFVATNYGCGRGHDFVGRGKGRGGLTPDGFPSRSFDDHIRFSNGQSVHRGFDSYLPRLSSGSLGLHMVQNGHGRGLLPTPSSVNIMATKNVIADLVKGEKLNGDNYDVWHKKMKFMLNEQELEEHLTKEMVVSTEALQNDLIGQYDELPTCKALWEQLKFTFGGTSTTRLRSLVIKFEEYTKDPKHTMSEHLRVMSNMIGKLRDAGHALTDEQQVRVVIKSIPASWANMKQILTHRANKGIGLEICHLLASKGILVILIARDEKKGLEATENLKVSGLSNVGFHQLD
ncbi:hypothetical protein RJ640_020197, partial [Escallonia rubra]